MRAPFSTLLLAALTPEALGHYNFESLIVNGVITQAYEYVRRTTNGWSPIGDVNSQDMVCNQGGLDPEIMANTKTHKVAPGDEVGFGINIELGHPGPLAVYMSRAPDGTSANEYKGDGDWFKAYALTTSGVDESGIHWANYPDGIAIRNFTFTLPSDLLSGDYLMRAEHIAVHNAKEYAKAQIYIGCAQLSVEGSGSGSPSPTVKIPGVYDGYEPGILIDLNEPHSSYTAPGPDTWPNACEDSTVNQPGQPSDGDCTGS